MSATVQDLVRPRAGRIAALDGLRAVAVLAVFILHVNATWLPGGGLGVDVFFVLSGFVITRLLLRDILKPSALRLRRFYWNRFTRLTPALLVMLGIMVPTLTLLGTHEDDVRHAPLAAIYLMNFYRAAVPIDAYAGGMFGHTWSLAVEEQFYLLWPMLLLALVARVRRTRQHQVVLVVCALVLAERFLLAAHSPNMTNRLYNSPDTRFDQLLFGCALALYLTNFAGDKARLQAFDARIRRLAWPSAAVLTAFLVIPQGTDLYARFGSDVLRPTITGLTAAVLVALTARQGDHLICRSLSLKPVLAIGTVSYSFYLWHYPVITMVNDYGTRLPTILLSFAITLPVAVLSWRLVETRFHQSNPRHQDEALQVSPPAHPPP